MIPEPHVRTMVIRVSCVPTERHFSIYVVFRNHRDGKDWYSVADEPNAFDYPRCLDRDGNWTQESKPYSYSPSWRTGHQFELDEAIEIARKYAPFVTVGGYTIEDAIRMRETRDVKRR
jgi:hypothetical protein